MERELKKDLMEIEHLIKDHEQRGNTHTQSVLQIAYEVIEPCAKVARTLPDLKEILERDNAVLLADIKANKRDNGRLIFGTCPKCKTQVSNIEGGNFCQNCGQRLKWED